MKFETSLFKVSAGERKTLVTYLVDNSYPGDYFFVMLIASVVIATGGLILNNIAVVIGSALVAPFLAPFLSLSMGVVIADMILIRKSAYVILKAILVTIIASAGLSFFITVPSGYNLEILSRTAASLPYLYIALAAGVAASFSIAHPKLSAFLVGVAVSVSLLPPLAVTGIGISTLNLSMAVGSLELFFVNLLGIVIAGIVVFSLIGFYPVRAKVNKVIKDEEKKVKAGKPTGGATPTS